MENSTINTNYNSPITMNKQFIPMDQRTPAKIFNKNDNIKKENEEKGGNNIIFLPTQALVFENLQEHQFVVGRDKIKTKKNGEVDKVYEYTIINNKEELLQFIENTEQEKRNFYEMMVCNDTIKKQLKLSFDIDLKEFMCDYKKHSLVQCIVSKVMDLLNDTFRLNIKNDDFVIIDSSNNEKTSFHIILHNYNFENVLAL